MPSSARIRAAKETACSGLGCVGVVDVDVAVVVVAAEDIECFYFDWETRSDLLVGSVSVAHLSW